MKQTVKISLDTPSYDEAIFWIEKDIFIKEVYMLQAEQVTDGDIQRWIDYGLGMPVRNTGFGEVWYEMMSRTLIASKAHTLNENVGLWWGQLKLFIHSMRV